MIFISLISSSFAIIPKQYSNLSKFALSKSFLKQTTNYEKNIFYPGKYQHDRISFEVKNVFTTTNNINIRSFALDEKHQVIALVLKNDQIIQNGSFLSDQKTSKIYHLTEMIGKDNKVTLYKYQITDLLKVLSNIKITYNSEDKSLKEDNINNNSYYSIGYPKNCSYDELKSAQTKFIPFSISSNDENISFGAKIGGYTSFSTSYEFTFTSNEEFYSQIKFLGEAKMESGFHFTNSSAKIDNLKILATDLHTSESEKVILNHYIYEIFGFQLIIDFYLNFNLHVDEISIDSAPDFYLTSLSSLSFNKEYEYSSSKNEKITTKTNSYNYQLDFNLLNNDDDYNDINVHFEPIIDLSVSADIKFIFTGNEPSNVTIETGVRNSYYVEIDNLTEQNNMCLYPYLSYSYIPYLFHIFFISNDVNMNTIALIKNKNLISKTFWNGEKIGPRCIYGCYNADSSVSIEIPVFYSDEINNTNSNQLSLGLKVGDNKFNVDIKGDNNLNFLKRTKSKDDNLTFFGHSYDPCFSNSLLLTFYPKKFQSNSYSIDQMTTITDFYFTESNLFFNFFQGIKLKMFEEVYPNESNKFAFIESPFNLSLIHHRNDGNQKKYIVKKMNISDDQFSTEEKYSYFLKNNWKIKISGASYKITVMLINSSSNITEKSFLYDENTIFNMDDRKLGLLIEFEKGETKFILINFDFKLHKQFEQTEELYYNTKIKITLIPHTPVVFFDLDYILNTNETGLIGAPIIDNERIYSFDESKEIKISLDKTKEKWKYLIYHLKTDFREDMINDTLFIAISSTGFYPLNAKEEFYNNIYLLEFTEFIFENGYLVFYIPFIRDSDYKEDEKIVVLSIFVQPLINDAFCPNSFHYSQFNSKITIGCIENNFNFESPLILTAIDQTGKQYIPIQMFFEQDALVYVNLFNQKNGMNCLIARLPNIFPEDSLTLNFDNLLVDALVSYSFNSIKIKCERCSGIFRNGETYQLNDDHKIEIKIIKEQYGDYYAICSNYEDRFCIQKLSLNPNKVTLINRPMITNFVSLNYLENLPEIIIPKAQLFSSYGKSLLIYSKDTKYGLSIANVLETPIELKLQAATRGNFFRIYTMTMSNIYFPFSPVSILSSLDESLNQLGLNPNELSYYKIRDEIFVNNRNAFLSSPTSLSCDLLYGLSSSVIKSILINYQISSLNPESYQKSCICFVETTSQECYSSGYTSCTNYLKIAPHEFNNVDAYFHADYNNANLVLHFEVDVNNFYPDLSVFPSRTWKLFFTSSQNHKVSGALIIPYPETLDSINRIDCSNLDATVEVSIQDQQYGHLDFSSSNSHVTTTIIILNEINYRNNKVNLFFNRYDLIANAHYLQAAKLSKSSKKISVRSEYIYKVIDTFSYHGYDDHKGHYRLFIGLKDNGYHLNDSFCFHGSSECVSHSINTDRQTLHIVGDIIDSYPDVINCITIEAFNSNGDFYSDSFYKVASKHQNVLIIMKSSTGAIIKPTMDIYDNLNISFEGDIDLTQLTLKIQTKIGLQRNISVNNRIVQKVIITTICPDKEIAFDEKQIIIKDYKSGGSVSLEGTSCNLAHSTLTISLGIDSNLFLSIKQQFNSYPNEYCLFAFSPNECESIQGLPVRIGNFNTNFIQSGNLVTITIVDDYNINLNLQGKSIIFKGINNKKKLSGTFSLSSDCTVSFQNVDVSELNLIFSFDISNNKVTTFDFIRCETLPNSFECKLVNPTSILLKTKFANLNVFENISLNWIPLEISYENIIISTEVIIDENSAYVKLNHIKPSQVLCYYTSDSSKCPSISTIIPPSNQWKNYNNSLIYISDNIDISDIEIKDQIVYFSGNGRINGKLTLSGFTICHFIGLFLVYSLTVETQVDFESKKAPKIVFGVHDSYLWNWNLVIKGYDITCSFCIFENKQPIINEIKSNVNSKIVVEKKNYNTEIHFIQLYEPNHFCVYDYPYESLCLTKYSQYLPVKSSELWDIKLNSIETPKIIFASKSSSMFLPLKRFKDENIQTTLIDVLPFSSFPTFLVPEDFTLIINGDSSNLTAKVSIDTTTLQYGKIVFKEISHIQLIPTDKIVIYDEEKILLLNENGFLTIFYEIQQNDLFNMSEIVIKSTLKNYDYNSESIDDLYNDESTELKTLILTKETVLNYSNLKNKKLGIYGSNNVLSLTSKTNSNPSFIEFLFINSSTIIFDSFLNFEIGVFNSNINLYPFSIKEQISPEISLKYRNSIDVYDGSFIKIDEDKISINNEEFSFDQNQFDLYLDDFGSINDLIGKGINIYGTKSLICIEKTENSSYSFFEFEDLTIRANNDLSNISIYNTFLINFDSNIEVNIDYYVQKSKSGNLHANKTPANIKQIDLYGKPFYCNKAFVNSLNVYESKSLVKGVNLRESLHINPNATLIAHESTFLPTISTYFNILTASPLLVLVNSTFDCNELIIYFDYSYQNEEFVLIKGLESLEYCEYIKNKSDESRYKINYDLSCRINEIDELVELVAGNCTVFSKEFTESNKFTESVEFSTSFQFTYSSYFSKTTEFTNTPEFSFSNDFSDSKEFTESNKFTESIKFSTSFQFTYSSYFSKTTEFTYTPEFSFSNDFSDSKEFTESIKFSTSFQFTYSSYFSKTTEFTNTPGFSFSNDFSDSKEFTESNKFTESVEFSTSFQFTYSSYFSKTTEFTYTSEFSFSNDFSDSRDFTESNTFILSSLFSSSNKFTYSEPFSETSKFSFSSHFTFSKDFTDSTAFKESNIFTKSNVFTATNIFSCSSLFTKTTEFTISAQFSETKVFSNSLNFSNSNEFTLSNFFITQTFSGSSSFTDSSYFSQSSIFTSSEKFKQNININTLTYFNPHLTYSRSTVMSFSVIKTVVFSYLNSMFMTYIECFNENKMNSYCLTNIHTYSYLPYIIHSYMTTYVVTYLPFLITKRRGITKEQLIAVSCFSAALFFLIIGIIIMAKKKSKENSEGYSIFSEEEDIIERKEETQVIKSDIFHDTDNDDRDLNFWL